MCVLMCNNVLSFPHTNTHTKTETQR